MVIRFLAPITVKGVMHVNCDTGKGAVVERNFVAGELLQAGALVKSQKSRMRRTPTYMAFFGSKCDNPDSLGPIPEDAFEIVKPAAL